MQIAGKAVPVLSVLAVLAAAGCVGQMGQGIPFNFTYNVPSGNTGNQSVQPACSADWHCSDWNECSPSGRQTRSCADDSGCGTDDGRPVESRPCEAQAPLPAVSIVSSDSNREPYYGFYCDKMDPYDLSVRTAAAEAIRNHSGPFSQDQLLDLYDWVKGHITYQNVPLLGIPYPPSDTLTTGSGDCKNQAVLIASMVGAIGGTAKVVLDDACTHAYALVYLGASQQVQTDFSQAVTDHYGTTVNVNYVTGNGTWVVFDPAGGYYPGSTVFNCTGNRSVHFVTSCLECAHQVPSMPFTYGDRCHAQCPAGTVSTGQHYCTACQTGYSSCGNQCMKCQAGYELHTDCLCYPQSGSQPGTPVVNGTTTFSGFQYVVPIAVDYSASGGFGLYVENREGEPAEITSVAVDGKELADFKPASLGAGEGGWLTGSTGTAGTAGSPFSVQVEIRGLIYGKDFFSSGTVTGTRS